MPLLFSYGTLRKEETQRSLFGRALAGENDELPGYILIPSSAASPFANIVRDGRPDSIVRGMVFEITAADLAAADRYERADGYDRLVVTLASGREAWVYRDVRPARLDQG